MDLKIACPKCDWEPSPSDLWQCNCGHLWHTFDTGGRCPKCQKQWAETSCFPPYAGGCGRWSAHLDWYRELDGLIEEIIEASTTVDISA